MWVTEGTIVNEGQKMSATGRQFPDVVLRKPTATKYIDRLIVCNYSHSVILEIGFPSRLYFVERVRFGQTASEN
jgi:hypothetical protein